MNYITKKYLGFLSEEFKKIQSGHHSAYDPVYGNLFSVDISNYSTETHEVRIKLIDQVSELENKRLLQEKDVWGNMLKPLAEKWKEISFEEAKPLLKKLLQYDLAYNTERLPKNIVKNLFNEIIDTFQTTKIHCYCNYKLESYTGAKITDNWTFDYVLIFMSSNILIYTYFLSED